MSFWNESYRDNIWGFEDALTNYEHVVSGLDFKYKSLIKGQVLTWYTILLPKTEIGNGIRNGLSFFNAYNQIPRCDTNWIIQTFLKINRKL